MNSYSKSFKIHTEAEFSRPDEFPNITVILKIVRNLQTIFTKSFILDI